MSELINQLFAQRLDELVRYYEETGIDYIIYGAHGRNAVLGLEQDPHSSLGHIDIDVMVFSNPNQVPIKPEKWDLMYPNIEVHGPLKEIISVEQGKMLLRYRDITVEISPEVFEAYPVEYFGVTINTLRPETLLCIPYLYGRRPKDRKQIRQLEKLIGKGFRQLTSEEEQYKPFMVLDEERKKRYPFDLVVKFLRDLYHIVVPYRARVFLSPLVQKTRTILGIYQV
ncbi:hypothetical protein JW930_03980 [Candidatus Woesearchaeota archaeon]|nr:hypothetical protein [Candidatus Woesearchaeota archaeon]